MSDLWPSSRNRVACSLFMYFRQTGMASFLVGLVTSEFYVFLASFIIAMREREKPEEAFMVL